MRCKGKHHAKLLEAGRHPFYLSYYLEYKIDDWSSSSHITQGGILIREAMNRGQ